jgi:hypothetical protein
MESVFNRHCRALKMSSTDIKIKILEPPKWELLNYVYLTPKEIYEIYTSDNVEPIRVENVVIALDRKNIFLSEACYSRYKFDFSVKKGVVQKESLMKERLRIAESLMGLVAIYTSRGDASLTIYNKIYYIITRLNLGLSIAPPNTLESARNLLTMCITDLREQVRKYIPKNKAIGQARIGSSANSVVPVQNALIEFLCHHVKVNKTGLTQGIKLIVGNSNKNIITSSPISEVELAQEFNFYTVMFRELSTIILDNEALPKKINFIESSHWVTPSQTFMKIEQTIFTNKVSYWNYEDGTNYTRDFIEKVKGFSLTEPQWYLRRKRVKESFVKQNEEWSATRRNIATIALKAYFMQLTILTGMNDSVLSALPFDDDFEITKESQNFKGIKYRAKGKNVYFSIQSEFISDFKLFIKLRKYILEKHNLSTFSNLFFTFSQERKNSVSSLPNIGQVGTSVRATLKRHASFKLNTSSVLRVTKGLWVRKGFGETVSAYVLQHSISTSMTSYSGNNAIDTSDELTEYFEWFNEKVFNQDFNVKTETGGCASQYEPDFASGTPDVFQNCGKGEGCLFCSSYRLHKDETDLRKLFSLKFLVKECAVAAASNEHFNTVYEPLINRIDSLVAELIKSDQDLQPIVNSVEKSVFEDEKLTPFWLRKYETLIDLGVL